MRELTMMEIDTVAGGDFFSRVGAAVLGVVTGISTGTAKGGVSGGSTGGILGAGIISAGVTMIWGGIMGAVQGGLYGLVNDWDATLELFNNNTEQWADMTINTPSV